MQCSPLLFGSVGCLQAVSGAFSHWPKALEAACKRARLPHIADNYSIQCCVVACRLKAATG
eukprot:5970677-Alexandrium_andersonii.AAC.1